MGSDPAVDRMAFENEQWSTERNQGTVVLPLFYIGRYEVTVAQFGAFIAATGYKAEQLALSGKPDHPVVNVSWTDALAYARWLDSQLKVSPHTPAPLSHLLNDGWQVTIPNEAQWEKAARSSDGRIYPWGNVASREFANYAGTSTTAVGSFGCPKCAFDLADMSGNVWELTRSAYQAYPFDLSALPNLQIDALFVMRGGSYNDGENTIRTATRGGIDPGARRSFIGFRVVITRD
jgi:formylglycine-generating enzyme required for sulfatase activity